MTPTWGQEVGATGCVVLSLPWKFGILGPKSFLCLGRVGTLSGDHPVDQLGWGCQVLRFPPIKWELVGPTR